MALEPYLHKVQYYETDQMGIVHHSNYIRWFEEARTDTMEQIDYGYERMEAEGVIIPVLSISCDYKSMTSFGETVAIDVVYKNFSGVRFEAEYTVRDSETGEIRATGMSKHATLNEKHRPISLKRSHPDMYKALIHYFDTEGGKA